MQLQLRLRMRQVPTLRQARTRSQARRALDGFEMISFAVLQAALPKIAQPQVIAVGIAYFAVIIGISIWASRRTKTASGFFVAGQGIGLVALTVASVSTSVSGFAFIGGPGLIYTVGLGAMFLVLPASVTNVMGAWVLAKRMRLLGEARSLMTIPDAIGARYR